MKCYRYAIEGYDDFIHRRGHFKGYKIFIPDPYNFCVFTLDNKIRYMKRQDKIDDFSNEHFGFNPTIYEIEMDEDIIKKLYENLEQEEQVKHSRELLEENILQFQTLEEKIEKSFKDGLEYIKQDKYFEAIEKFKYCLVDSYAMNSLFNISCCYSLMGDKNNAIKNLKEAINKGYGNWFHIITDDDLKNIRDEPEVIEMIKHLLKTHPEKNAPWRSLDKDGNDQGDRYIKKHNLEAYYKKESKINRPYVS